MRGAEEVRYGHVNNDDDVQATVVTRLTDINSNPNSSSSAPDAPPIAFALEKSASNRILTALDFHNSPSWRTSPLVPPLTPQQPRVPPSFPKLTGCSARRRNRLPQGRLCRPGMSHADSQRLELSSTHSLLLELPRAPVPLDSGAAHLANGGAGW
jgi:hypothetical protein